MKYTKISIVILSVSFISIFAYKLTTNNSTNKLSLTKEQMKEMISYTIDGNSTSSMPTKGSGYKVKSITCKSGSILSWDNDNWLLEVEKLESEDLCNIDFTTGTGGYTVTAVPSIAGSLDSTSKTTTENGTVTFYTNLAIDSVSGCTNEISDGKVIVKNVTSNTTCNINVSYMKLYDRLLADNPTRSTRSNDNNGTNDFEKQFANITTGTLFTSTESIAGITDSPKKVYYYAGNTANNWVKFGGYYWRIIRTNHDGSIRLLYVGTSHDTTNGKIGTSKFNTNSDSPKYVGYKYGENTSLDTIRDNTTNSTIKTTIDNWYSTNMTSYTKYLSTSAVYCNDRSLGTGQTYSASSQFNFASMNRIVYNRTAGFNPSYNCSDIRDAFSVDNTSAKLDYPIALMTADEISYAGGMVSDPVNSDPYACFWFNNNSIGDKVSTSWWLLSPLEFNFGINYSFVISWNHYYINNSDNVGASLDVRPVVSLKADVLHKSGDGSAESPYEIVMN